MIKSIDIKNIKGFVNVQIPLNNLTIFAGLNGMGKSTFIQSLLLLRQSYISGRFPDKGGLLLNGDLTTVGIGKDFFAFDAKGDEIEINIQLDSMSYFKSKFEYDAFSDTLPLKDFDSNINLDDVALFNNNFQYLHAERLSPERDFFPGSPTNVKNGYLGRNGQFTVHYLAENQRKDISIESLKHPHANTMTLLDNVDAWIGELSPGIKVNPKYNPQLNSATLSYNYTNGNEVSEDIKPINVGFGLTYILPVITALLISKPGDLVIIENPESHIHPGGQSSIAHLFSLAALAGVQVIVETHSDHIINGVLVQCKMFENSGSGIDKRSVKIYHFQRNESNYSSIPIEIVILKDGKIENQPKDFFDQAEKDLNYLLGF